MQRSRLTWEQAVLAFRADPRNAALAQACFYDDPLIDSAMRYATSSEWRAVQKWLPKPSRRALDIGSGRGISAFALAREGWVVSALEPDGSDVVGVGAIRQLAAASGLPIRAVQQSAEELPFVKSSFELVHGRAVLHHAKDLRRLCCEAARVLVPGGRLVALREHVISRKSDLESFLDAHPLHHLYGGENAYLLGEYLDSIRSAGFKLLCVAGPWSDDVNAFPDTVDDVRARLAKRVSWPWPKTIPRQLVAWLGNRLDTPGRLYSFVAEKLTDG